MLTKSSLLVLSLLFGGIAHADTIQTVTFDDRPTGPSLFVLAGPKQTIVYPGAATFTNGVILGNATNFPGIIYATGANTYATAGFGDNLTNNLTITIDPDFVVDEVSFALFNGATITSSYLVNAFSGNSVVATQTFLNIPQTLSSGFVLPDLKASDITSVTISSLTNDPNTNGYDFAIDTIAFNESIQQAVGEAPGSSTGVTPEPSSFVLFGTGISGILGTAYRRARQTR